MKYMQIKSEAFQGVLQEDMVVDLMYDGYKQNRQIIKKGERVIVTVTIIDGPDVEWESEIDYWKKYAREKSIEVNRLSDLIAEYESEYEDDDTDD